MSAERIDVLAVMDRKQRASFRDAGMRSIYEGCVAAYRAKGAGYMAEGNSAAVMFRRGFTGAHVGKWDAASRKTFAYAQFRAGQDCAADEARAAVAELIEVSQFDIQRRPDAEGVPAYCPGWCVVDRHGDRRGPWCFDADSAISVARAQIRAALARVGGGAA